MLKFPGINATTHIHLKDMEYKKLIKLDTNKNATLVKKEAALSSSEALTEIVFLSSSNYNRLGYLIVDLRQDMMKGKKYYLSTFTNAYDLLTRFELAFPRHHRIKHTGDKGNRGNHGGRSVSDHEFVQHTTPLGTVFILGLDGHT